MMKPSPESTNTTSRPEREYHGCVSRGRAYSRIRYQERVVPAGFVTDAATASVQWHGGSMTERGAMPRRGRGRLTLDLTRISPLFRGELPDGRMRRAAVPPHLEV